MNPTPEHTASQPPLRTMTARTPEDIAAFVPIALGFVPERSVVMISVGAAGGMHARVDLPDDPDDVDDVVEVLLRPARRHHVRAVVFVIYDDDTTVADEAGWALNEAFEAARITVKDVLRIHDDHWFAVLPGREISAYNGVRFQRSDHSFTAQGVFDGRVTHTSREALRATLAPDPSAVASTTEHLRAVEDLAVGGLRALVEAHLDAATTFTDSELASVAVSVVSGSRREEAWAWLDRAQGRASVDLWVDAVRRLPETHVAAPASVLAFAAWLAGDGALAWCAVDRSLSNDPRQSLANLVAGLLESATSPADWETLRPQLKGAADPAA